MGLPIYMQFTIKTNLIDLICNTSKQNLSRFLYMKVYIYCISKSKKSVSYCAGGHVFVAVLLVVVLCIFQIHEIDRLAKSADIEDGLQTDVAFRGRLGF